MHDGPLWRTGSPADFSRPDAGSIRNTAMLFPGVFAQSSQRPSDVTARFCGPFPRLGSMATSESRPSSAIRYAAMLSCPRFVPYRKRPSGVTFTSAQKFVPPNYFGRVGIVCFSVRTPEVAS
jgi:hypothetical protein